MNTRTFSAHFVAGLICLGAGLAQAQASKPATGTEQGSMQAGHGSQAMHKSMMSGMDSMGQMKMSGDTDKDFAMMMKMHHQQGIEMAKIEAEHGKSPEMKALAKKIMAEQKKEIAQLDKFLQKNR
jgi:uncharacterized protein (DUF305 family)